MVEMSLVMVVILFPMVVGMVGLGRILQTQMAVSAVAREAARSGALVDKKTDVEPTGETHGYDVGKGYRLTNPPLAVHVDPSNFQRCGSVAAHVTYDLTFGDLPMLGWAHMQLKADHVEPVDGFRSGLPGQC
jgi:hypothetical protein